MKFLCYDIVCFSIKLLRQAPLEAPSGLGLFMQAAESTTAVSCNGTPPRKHSKDEAWFRHGLDDFVL